MPKPKSESLSALMARFIPKTPKRSEPIPLVSHYQEARKATRRPA